VPGIGVNATHVEGARLEAIATVDAMAMKGTDANVARRRLGRSDKRLRVS